MSLTSTGWLVVVRRLCACSVMMYHGSLSFQGEATVCKLTTSISQGGGKQTHRSDRSSRVRHPGRAAGQVLFVSSLVSPIACLRDGHHFVVERDYPVVRRPSWPVKSRRHTCFPSPTLFEAKRHHSGKRAIHRYVNPNPLPLTVARPPFCSPPTSLGPRSLPASMHPHGVLYTPENEGAKWRLNNFPGSAVDPGDSFVYEWIVREDAGPTGSDSSNLWCAPLQVVGKMDEWRVGGVPGEGGGV